MWCRCFVTVAVLKVAVLYPLPCIHELPCQRSGMNVSVTEWQTERSKDRQINFHAKAVFKDMCVSFRDCQTNLEKDREAFRTFSIGMWTGKSKLPNILTNINKMLFWISKIFCSRDLSGHKQTEGKQTLFIQSLIIIPNPVGNTNPNLYIFM